MSNFIQISKTESVNTFDVRRALSAHNLSRSSAIDRYYGRAESLLLRASQADAEGRADLIPLLFLRLISAAESYVREVLAGLPRICPEIRGHSAAQQIVLGAAYHYGDGFIGLAAIEHVSFCSEGEITKQTLRLTNFHCQKDQSLQKAIENFEAVSQLRHATVHAYDEVYFNNVRSLDLHSDDPPARYVVSITPLVFQEFVAVCHSLVRAYNRAMFEHVLSLWVSKERLTKVWQKDKLMFEGLLSLFLSTTDMGRSSTSYGYYRRFLAKLKESVAAT